MCVSTLPRSEVYRFDDDVEEVGQDVEFRLIYKGPLHASTNHNQRYREKHEIRKVLHKQLAELWEKNSVLHDVKTFSLSGSDGSQTGLSALANRFDRCGFKFAPLITSAWAMVCHLDILFLRRDNPGDLIMQGGDMDNRLKTLFDAFRVPRDCNEVRGFAAEPDENPFFCLLEDDSLISELKVTTDRLLIPLKDGHQSNVLLVIGVKVRVTKLTAGNIEFAS